MMNRRGSDAITSIVAKTVLQQVDRSSTGFDMSFKIYVNFKVCMKNMLQSQKAC